jgi:hypothetical protein
MALPKRAMECARRRRRVTEADPCPVKGLSFIDKKGMSLSQYDSR